MSDTDTLADVLRERYGPDLPAPKQDVLWSALMVCHDCPHRMIDHDEVAMRCTVCRCNQSDRGLSSRADDRLWDLGMAMRDAWPDEVAALPSDPAAPLREATRFAKAITGGEPASDDDETPVRTIAEAAE